jgi:molybdopterin/thiamine biosynthesis adenylyltransferase
MHPQPRPDDSGEPRYAVCIVGLGLIGSHLVRHLITMPQVTTLLLIDDGVYEHSNLRGQFISPQDVGTPKVIAQARQLRRLNPAVSIDARVARVEEIPMGILRQADFAVCCVDSREARRHCNRLWQHLRVTWVDVAVEAGGTLVRVGTYVPGQGSCLLCSWGPDDFARLAQKYPCRKASPAPSTRGTSATGAIAGALSAMEVAKLVNGRTQELLLDSQIYLDARHHRLDVVRFGENPDCPCDRTPWRINTIATSARELSLHDVLALQGDGSPSAVALDGQVFVQRLHCLSCAWRSRSMLRLSERLRTNQRTCRHCGGELAAAAFDVVDTLSAGDVSPKRLAGPLHDLGFLDGDVFTLLSPGEQPAHFQIGA